MKKVYILRGPSGAGKTYYAKEHHSDAWYCSSDLFFEASGVYEFDSQLLPIAHQECMFRFLMGVEKGEGVIVVDNTFTRKWEYINYWKVAKLLGYEVAVLEFMPETVEELKLIAGRNIHQVPEAIVAAQIMRFESCEEAIRVSPR